MGRSMCAQRSTFRRAVAADPAIELLFAGPAPPNDSLEYDLGFFARQRSQPLVLLADDHAWRGADGRRTRVPLALCEFLSYKAALAYEPESRIREHLEKSPGVSDIEFFAGDGGGLADTQGYGFTYQDRGYIVMRGTKEKVDWRRSNLTDSLTNALMSDGRAAERLKKKFAAIYSDEAPVEPDCHLGFFTGWRVVRSQIEAWLARIEKGEEPPSSYIFSGHSLGGALAFLGAYDFASGKFGKRPVAAVVTFGAPMVGTQKFVDRYQALLGDKTIRVEAKGDSVPDIMGRFYYRVLWYARQIVQHMALPKEPASYRALGVPFEFEAQPILSRQAFLETITAAEASLKRQAEEAAKKKPKPQDTAAPSGTGDAPASKPAASTGAGGQAPAPGEKPGDESKAALIVIGGIVLLIAIIILYCFARGKMQSHAVLNRYALFFSTLSYQQLRAINSGRLDLANTALVEHLAQMHRDYVVEDQKGAPKSPPTFYDAIRGGPFLLEEGDAANIAKFLDFQKGVSIC